MQLAQVGSKFYRSSNVFSSSERLELMGAPPFRAVTQLPASNYVLSNCTLQSLWFWRANAWTFFAGDYNRLCSLLCVTPVLTTVHIRSKLLRQTRLGYVPIGLRKSFLLARSDQKHVTATALEQARWMLR